MVKWLARRKRDTRERSGTHSQEFVGRDDVGLELLQDLDRFLFTGAFFVSFL